ncbi:tryptophan 7-halogenase [uncultured Paludibaculum sp.]|uniref:NAD(P)/FAD-dependent oxidoreductase n=1 Tax=uncultured Paludibaculum sp. TaxID=1765020 RepID=UPI002AAA8BC4|nr:tryptophan 7-halogenase [uncultured Paludibaculum sp.]
MTPRCYDCVLIGGGPAGAAAAIALRWAGAKVLVVEESQFDTARRGEMLPPSVMSLIERLGAAEDFAAGQHWPVWGVVSEWGPEGASVRDFITSPYGSGWHLDRVSFDRMLARVAARWGSEVQLGVPMEKIRRDGREWVLQSGSTLARTPFVVDASGRRGWLLRRMGVRARNEGNLIGLAATWPDATADHWTRIRAVEGGWWYTAMLPGGQRLAAFFTDVGGCNLQGAGWSDVWRSMAHSCPVAAPQEMAPRIAAAHTMWREQVEGEAWMAIGDAALARDPLSASGIRWALESGLRVPEVLLHGESAKYGAWVESERREHLDLRRNYYALACSA